MERALRGDRKRWESKTQERGRDSKRGQRVEWGRRGRKEEAEDHRFTSVNVAATAERKYVLGSSGLASLPR